MGYAVELPLDNSNSIRDLFEATGSLMVEIGASPHISLEVFEDTDDEILDDVVRHLADQTTPLTIRFQSIGVFPGKENVVFLAPVVTSDLLRLDARFHRNLTASGLRSNPRYSPDAWVPHCTITIDETTESSLHTLKTIHSQAPSDTFGISGVEIIRFRPAEVLSRYGLSG